MDQLLSGRPVVLIVDSQQFLIDLLREHLSKDSIQVISAASGAEACPLFDRLQPSLALVNTSVPGSMDFIRYVRSADTPSEVIALADSPESQQRIRALGIGVVLGRDANLQSVLTAMRGCLPAMAADDAPDDSVRILVVDDETEILTVIGGFLARLGYSVMTAESGRKALETLKRHPEIRIVLLDLKIPDGGGLEVLREIMRGKQHPGVIMMSGVQDSDIAKLAFKIGAFDYFTKPFDWQRLDGLITGCLSHMEYKKQSSWGRI